MEPCGFTGLGIMGRPKAIDSTPAFMAGDMDENHSSIAKYFKRLAGVTLNQKG